MPQKKKGEDAKVEEEEHMGQMFRRQNLLGVNEEQLPRLVDQDQDLYWPLCPETEGLLRIQTLCERIFLAVLSVRLLGWAHWTEFS